MSRGFDPDENFRQHSANTTLYLNTARRPDPICLHNACVTLSRCWARWQHDLWNVMECHKIGSDSNGIGPFVMVSYAIILSSSFYAPLQGGHIVIALSVRPSVCLSVTKLVRSVTPTCLSGMWNNLVQMFTPLRRCAAIKTQVHTSKVKVINWGQRSKMDTFCRVRAITPSCMNGF